MQGRNVSFITLPIQTMYTCIVNTIYHALHCQYRITFSGLSIQNLMDWTVNTRSQCLIHYLVYNINIYSQYNISWLALQIQYHILWTVNTKYYRLGCQYKVSTSHSLHGLYKLYIYQILYRMSHTANTISEDCHYSISFSV